ncbi:MAG: hypothetical protein QOF46_892 [Paraburkholderia sp.]|nr:hypothetical protein [Paraburkholderia sp.]
MGGALIVAEAEAGEFALAARDRNRKRRFHLTVTSKVFRRHRLLEPSDVLVLDHPAEANRRSRIVGVIRFDHQRDIRADGCPHRARHLHLLLDAEAHLELDGLESFCNIACRFFAQILQGIARCPPVQTRCIRLHLRAKHPPIN